jgi:DNA-binding PadR family transcriptional regulator
MSENNLPDLDDAPWLNLSKEEIEDLRKQKQELTEYGKEKIRKLMNKEPTHEEMLEEAARRELANKEFKDLTDQERVQLALEELDWIVIGGQDGEEFYNSIQFIRRVLKSFR